MVYTPSVYNATTGQTSFQIVFPYVTRSYVKVYKNNVLLTTTTEYTFSDADTITLTLPTLVGDVIRIERLTLSGFFSTPPVDRNLPPTYLSINETIMNHKTEELEYAVSATQTQPITSDLDMNNNKITNLLTGTASSDAVVKGQLDAAIANQTSAINALAASLTQAVTDATTQATAADASADSAQVAETNAQTAVTTVQGLAVQVAADALQVETTRTTVLDSIDTVTGLIAQAQSAVSDIVGYTDDAQAAATTATNAVTTITGLTTTATNAANTSTTQAGIATTKAAEASNAVTTINNLVDDATDAANAATVAAANATTAASNATTAANNAVTTITGLVSGVQDDVDAAALSAANANTSAIASAASAATANTKAGEATSSATTATAAATTATTKAGEATTAASTATTQAGIATTQATGATTSATNSSNSASAASAAQSQAAVSASTASTAATNAGASATAAGLSATAANNSAVSAGTSATEASDSADSASASATAASASATSATTSATTAATAATAASGSASSASTSATNASNSAAAAATSESNAAASATAAATSETNAAASATAASGSAISAAASASSILSLNPAAVSLTAYTSVAAVPNNTTATVSTGATDAPAGGSSSYTVTKYITNNRLTVVAINQTTKAEYIHSELTSYSGYNWVAVVGGSGSGIQLLTTPVDDLVAMPINAIGYIGTSPTQPMPIAGNTYRIQKMAADTTSTTRMTVTLEDLRTGLKYKAVTTVGTTLYTFVPDCDDFSAKLPTPSFLGAQSLQMHVPRNWARVNSAGAIVRIPSSTAPVLVGGAVAIGSLNGYTSALSTTNARTLYAAYDPITDTGGFIWHTTNTSTSITLGSTVYNIYRLPHAFRPLTNNIATALPQHLIQQWDDDSKSWIELMTNFEAAATTAVTQSEIFEGTPAAGANVLTLAPNAPTGFSNRVVSLWVHNPSGSGVTHRFTAAGSSNHGFGTTVLQNTTYTTPPIYASNSNTFDFYGTPVPTIIAVKGYEVRSRS